MVLGESGPPISQIIMSGLLSTMMLAPIAAEFGLNLTKWSPTSMPRLMLPATRVSAASFPSIYLVTFILFLQSGPFDDCNLLTVLLDKNSFFNQTVKIAAALLPSLYTGWDSHEIWLLLMQNLLKGLAWKVPFLLCGLFFWCYDRHPKIRRRKNM